MAKGLAPLDSSGVSLQLHHVMGRGYDIITPVTRSQHVVIHQMLGKGQTLLNNMMKMTGILG